jgi:hypothetical protein
MTQVVIQHPEIFNLRHLDYRFWGIMSAISLMAIYLYWMLVETIRYKVTLIQEKIEVTTLYGTMTLQRSEIRSYRYIERGGRGAKSSSVAFNQKVPTGKTFEVPLTFDRDQEFDDWIMSLPCDSEDSPLPKRRDT